MRGAALRWKKASRGKVLLRRAVLLAAMPLAACGWPERSARAQEGEQAVENAREVLSRGLLNRHPWYDSRTDDVALVPLRTPQPARQPIDWNWEWPDWSWDFNLFGSSFRVNILTLLAWLVVLVGAYFLVRYLIRLYERREAQDAGGDVEDAAPATADRVEALPVPIKREVGDLLAEARRLYEAGNYNEAIVYLYGHLLVRLDRAQRIRLAKGKTNRQYLREAGRDAQLRPLLERTIIAFEDAYFGHHRLERSRFEACWDELPRFEALLSPQEVAV